MPDIDPPIGGLVPMRRFGAALTARRTRRRTTLSAIARRSDGWWTPDELLAIEQGAAILDDVSTVAVSRLYGLAGRALPSGEDVELLVDRTSAADVVDATSVEGRGFAEFAIQRLDALTRLLGVELVERADMLSVVAEAVTVDPGQIVEIVHRARSERGEDRRDLSDAVGRRVVVPEVGVLVVDSDAGAMVLVERRRRGRRRSPTVASLAPAGALHRYVERLEPSLSER